MRKYGLAGIVLAFCTLPALAGSCPTLMNDVDAMLDDDSVVSGLSASERERVRELRREGEQLHKDGSHGESVATLNEALEILGGGSSGGNGY